MAVGDEDPFAPRPVTFTHLPPAGTTSVTLVGGFNIWDRAAFPLILQADGKTWKGTFPIKPGVYPYLFCENGNRWVPDPKAGILPDANGNRNSKLVVEPADYDAPRTPDRLLTFSALRHRADRSDSARLNAKWAYVKLRARREEIVRAFVRQNGSDLRPMKRVHRDDLFEIWMGKIAVEQGNLTTYSFALEPVGKDPNKPKLVWPTQRPFDLSFRQDFSKYPLPNPPDWVQDAVFYQIFPERFANGNPANDGPDIEPWGAKPTPKGRMGGDLAGIRKRLGHLKDLGVSGLYLNPVFAAGSNHAYDTDDYERVDARFGTNAELKSLVEALKKQGVRTILDAVLNHSSPNFFAFRDVVNNGAESKYKDWYYLSGFPVSVEEGQKHYRTFAGVPTMPKLNQDDPSCREYFLGIGEKWLRETGVAGWRLDVADEVGHDFWRAFRTKVKKTDPDAFILGEVWGDAHEYLQGDQHDSVMNYRWRKAVLDLLAYKTIDVTEFLAELERIREDYPDALLTSVFNLLGSHDTERVRTIFKGDRKGQRLATVFQFTYPGVPCIYYGDEIGLEGGRDPDCRRAMEWDQSKWDKGLFEHYRSLTALRNEISALRRGSLKFIPAGAKAGLILFDRSYRGKSIRVAINPGNQTISVPHSGAIRARISYSARVKSGQLSLGPKGYWVG